MLLLLSLAEAITPYRPLAETCRAAPVIVVAEVTGAEVMWSATSPGNLETWVDIAVTDLLKGSLPAGARIVLRGGALGGLRQSVEDVPALEPDHRYVLLLRPRVAGEWAPFGGEDGVRALGWQDDARTLLGSCLVP